MSDTRIRSMADYHAAYQRSITDPEGFWADVASTFMWQKPWRKVLEWDFVKPDVKWFIGGSVNITENCLDRHLATRGDKTAVLWEANDPAQPSEHITYKQLHERVCRMANVLKRNGLKKSDRVCLYMPMIPELAICVLACARIGAIHSVVFGGFSANSLVGADCPAEPMDSEDPLFILYTSGSTGKPKGIVHTTAGYWSRRQTHHPYVFDLKARRRLLVHRRRRLGHRPQLHRLRPARQRRHQRHVRRRPQLARPDRFWRIDREARRHHSTPRPPPSAPS
jgi:hypothetical protein